MSEDRLILTRRSLMASSLAGAAGVLLPVRLKGEAGKAGTVSVPRPRFQAKYGLALLGDIHYDKWQHHDMDWVKAEKPKDIRQIEGYVEVTETHTPRLLRRVRETIQSAPAQVPVTIQVGDFVEGLCGSYDLQALQFRDAIDSVEQAKLGTPFLLTKGNHDITGPGAKEAFDEVLLPWVAGQAKQKLTTAHYTWSHDEDLFVFFDAYLPDLDWLEAQSPAAREARHVFFIIHPPVVPYNARANWHVFDRPSESESRARLLQWLGKHGAIVLSGHLHRYAALTRQTEAGPFTEFANCSVIRHDREKPRNERRGVDQYNTSLLELESKFSPSSIDERRAWLQRERPHITSFDYALAAGYAMVWVYEDALEADVYLGYGDTPWKQPSLPPVSAAAG